MNENAESNTKIDILLEQYKIYSTLYQHEDNLTWTKLHRLLLLSAVLFTVLGVIIVDLQKFAALSMFLTVFGALASLVFFFSIFNGAMFIALRKQNATEIENALAQWGGMKILKDDKEKLIHISSSRALGECARKFRTPHMLFLLPLLLTVSWIVILIFVITEIL